MKEVSDVRVIYVRGAFRCTAKAWESMSRATVTQLLLLTARTTPSTSSCPALHHHTTSYHQPLSLLPPTTNPAALYCSQPYPLPLYTRCWLLVRIRAQIPAGMCCAASVCPLTRGHGGHTHTLPITLLSFLRTSAIIFGVGVEWPESVTTTRHQLLLWILRRALLLARVSNSGAR